MTKETKKSFTATVGLVIHSAGTCAMITPRTLYCVDPFPVADGIALGAAASAENTELEIVIFVAIMLHKVKCVIADEMIHGKSGYL